MTNWKLHIASDPQILYGKPIIKNTRIPVDLILEKLANGDSQQEILQAYPNLTQDDIVASLLFAADTIKNEIILKAS
ncbi:DUF433 domain-containing protein [Natronoflexus pectinivorans]|uniref:Uncharacterized protein (DUF433 family) n=1 Tax=Natronoflexus pectinivorans TaxID=682526 RepID=A0A4R2GFU4_9BACT|nr:DUF433 domain-containing protein [Natronoflexus pectinivorans]TCO06913.1 uncharacterized protein (DUF433 family) [Natronoflexus pectinivorans]